MMWEVSLSVQLWKGSLSTGKFYNCQIRIRDEIFRGYEHNVFHCTQIIVP